MSHGLEYPFGQFGSGVLAMSPPKRDCGELGQLKLVHTQKKLMAITRFQADKVYFIIKVCACKCLYLFH